MPVRNRKQKGLKVSTFALLLVVFKLHRGSKGVKRQRSCPAHKEHLLANGLLLPPVCVWGGGGGRRGGGLKGPGAVFSDCVVCFFCCL